MAQTQISGDGIKANAITNAHLHSSASISATKLADSGVTAGSYGSGSAIPAITVNAKGLVTSVSTNSINTDLVADSTPQLGGNLSLNSNNINGTGDIDITGNISARSTSSVASFIAKGISGTTEGYIQLNCAENSHGIKLKSPPHSAGQDYTLTFPQDIQNGKFLKTDSNGNLSWATPTDTNTQLSNSQVRAAVEAASDSNVFTDADHSKLNGIEASATADQTNSEIKTAYEANSNTNAFTDALLSKLNGIAASATNVTNNNQLTNGAGYVTSNTQLSNEQVQDIVGGMVSSNTESGITVTYQDSDGTLDFSVASQTDNNFTTTLKNKLDGIAAGATNVTNNNQLTNGAGYITSAALAGASDGGNAALLDGIDSTQFLRSDQDDSTTGILKLESNSQYSLNIDGNDNGKIVLQGSSNPYIRFREGTTDKAYIQWNSGGFVEVFNQETDESVRIKSGANGFVFRHGGNERTVWHSGNDGAGSGLDADTLDGLHASQISGFPSGTRMIFQQTSAPTGWTKDTSDTNQRALRVVSGSASSGGSVDFTSAFASRGVSGSIANTTQGGSIANGGNNTNNKTSYSTNNRTQGGSVGNHTLNTSRMPQHRHDGGAKGIHDAANGQYGTNARGNSRYPLVRFDALNGYANYDTYWTSYSGSSNSHNHGFSGSAHNHTMPNHSHSINAHSHSFSGSAHNHSFSGTSINLAVRYLDVIIAQKD